VTDRAILCVDDEAILLLSLKQELKRFLPGDILVETALNAEEADEVVEDLVGRGVRILLIISDWLMPGLRGDEFLIGVHARHPEIKAIMITGHADRASIERALRVAGVKKVFSKPWDKEEMHGIVMECIA
jgi:DNA-binding NtrC family response regulator